LKEVKDKLKKAEESTNKKIKELKKKKEKSKEKEKAGKKKGKSREPRPLREEDKWKLVAPKSGEKKTKEKNNKTYHWCQKHKMWTVHKPEDCNLGEGENKKKSENEKEKESAKKIKQALAAIADSDSDDSDEE
jgi:hypothetical protein